MSPPGTAKTAAPPHFAPRISGFFFGYFLFGGVTLPFFPVWLQSRGMGEVEIASLIAIPALVRVALTPPASRAVRARPWRLGAH